MTVHFNRAAFFITIGGVLVEILGRYPNNSFVVDVTPWQKAYENFIGLVPYKRYMHVRQSIKEKIRKRAGLPARYTGGKSKGFQLMDIATFSKLKKD